MRRRAGTIRRGPDGRVRRFARLLPGRLLGVGVLVLAGCRTAPLDAARENFYRGRVQAAADDLAARSAPRKDRVLFLMERGTIRQAAGDFEGSTRDFIEAAALLEELETYSLSRGAASLVVNDSVQDFRGAPYERTMLHALCALNHFALGRWDDAAVEARRILLSLDPDRRGEYPDDAFSRYVAGFAFEMIDDPSNAALQYRLSAERLGGGLCERTGRILPGADPGPGDAGELVVFLLLGRGPRGNWIPASAAPRMTLRLGERELGRGLALADTGALALETARIEALRKTAKTAARITLKEVLAAAAARSAESDAVGDLIRFFLIGLFEQPDTRRWETLPRHLLVFRAPCPPEIEAFTLEIRDAGGRLLRARRVEAPLRRRRSTWVSVVRDLPDPPPPIRP